VALILAARCFWAFLIEPGFIKALLAGLTLGAAPATKLTLLILYPCWTILFIGRMLQLQATKKVLVKTHTCSPVRFIILASVALIVSVLVIDATYLFHDLSFSLARWQPKTSSIFRGIDEFGIRTHSSWLLNTPLPIPLELVRGLDVQIADTERPQLTYLLGQTRLGGWWYWYPVAFLVKLPLPALILLILALFLLPSALRDCDHKLWGVICLLFPAAEGALVIITTTGAGTNAAFRYMIPSLALLCVWLGSAMRTESRIIKTIGTCCLVWLALDSTTGVPDHLGWQNELGWAWSRSSGQPALIGDSLDWSQDLVRLRCWISRHAHEGSTCVCVYGLGEAEPYHLRTRAALSVSAPLERPLYLALSANILYGYEVMSCVGTARGTPQISETQRAAYLDRRPCDYVGRTIRIYRLGDLVTDAVSAQETQETHRR